ncbi:MAG: 4Fe-4S dicluster domain-containing protein [Deltaproteobacteria bacterium]|nr:4Fe-4S dicluster domain-containing protein [Deltaproteobacteria bacterium]
MTERLETNVNQVSQSSRSPHYMAAEEVLPEIAEGKDSSSGKKEGEILPVDRRDFMRLFSLSAVAGAASCVRRPAEKAIAYVKQPIDQVPGVATHYASTCGSCPAGCGISVKTREGRPVKLEGNSEHPLNQGGLCALGQAEIQGLYHPERLQSPQFRDGDKWGDVTWDEALAKVIAGVKNAKKVGIFTGGATGHRHEFFEEVLKRLGSSEKELYTWEANSLYSSVSEAYRLSFGHADLPRMELSEAAFIVGVGTDFQVSGLSPVSHSKGFSQGRSVRRGRRNKFVQFESNLTLTGSTADERHVIPAGNESVVALLLVKALYENPASKGTQKFRSDVAATLQAQEAVLLNAYETIGVGRDVFDGIAQELIEKPSIVMAGSGANFDQNATLLQLAAIMANTLSGAFGKTIFFDEGWAKSPVRNGDLVRFEEAGKLDVLFVIDSDPLFSVPQSWKLGDLFSKIPLIVSIQSFPVETDRVAHVVLPGNHNLESWGDEQSIAGFWSMRQPAVRPTKNSRQAEDILLWVLASVEKNLPYQDYRAYLKKKWHAIYELIRPSIAYETFFKAVIRRGFTGKMSIRAANDVKDVQQHFRTLKAPSVGKFVLAAPLDHRLVEGRGAHLPILQEIGDALTSIAWDTWLAVNPHTAKKFGWQRNQLVSVTGPGGSVELAVYPLPGLHPDTVVIPRGNGHEDKRSTISYLNGVNPLTLVEKASDPLSGQPVTSVFPVEIKATGKWFRLAAMQKLVHDMEGRADIIKTMPMKEVLKKATHKRGLDDVPDLFPKLDEESKHRWGMSIDLDRCNGCGACMAACGIENNVPQAGREQILLGREMHWIRLDRYFRGDLNNPQVSVQPVMCQHCNHAPCEGVCPVYATTHDPEGLNAMTYNRCVGTRYCANACPYKVRRFNWWTHRWGEMGERLQDRNPRATNPDVTVRTKGVMEKCSFCLQRITDAKHNAKGQNREVRDGEVQTACQQTCPMNAIVFGNLKDPTSRVAQLRDDGRAYLMLGGAPEHDHFGLKTLPNVSYLAEVTLEEGTQEEHGHHG